MNKESKVLLYKRRESLVDTINSLALNESLGPTMTVVDLKALLKRDLELIDLRLRGER